MTQPPSRVETIGAQLAAALADAMEGDPGRWTKSWNATGSAVPHNPVSGAVYTGTNRLVLARARRALDYETGAWATYRQWQSKECQVRRGSHGVQVIRAFRTSCCDDKGCDGECGRRPRTAMRSFTVFNSSQIDGDEIPQHPRYGPHVPVAQWQHSEITAAFEALGADWRTGGNEAYYSPVSDKIVTPPPEAFASAGGYASTVAHEHAHWTGHSTRLDRPLVEVAASVEARAREELVAELAAVVVCNSLGMEHEPVANHAAYLKHWAGHLRSEKGSSILFSASSAASRAAEYIVEDIERSQERDSLAAADTTATPQTLLRPAQAAAEAPEPAPMAQRPPEAAGEAPGGVSDDERRRVARWMLTRAAAQPGADTERAAAVIAALLDLDVADMGAARSDRRRVLEMTL